MEIFHYQEQALKAWNALDPPDARERLRNDAIEALQDKRNPFIDRYDFVERISDF
jgi:endonuclease I